jgi:hypothetical protein
MQLHYSLKEAHEVAKTYNGMLQELQFEKAKILAIKGRSSDYNQRLNKIDYDMIKYKSIIKKTQKYIINKEIQDGLTKNYKESK